MTTSDPTYRSLLEDASDGIFVSDADRRFIDVNQKACEILGYSAAELLARRIDDLMDPLEIARSPIRLGELESGRPLLVERVLRRKDGTTFPAEITSRRVTRDRVVSIVRDVTGQREAAAALRKHHDRDRLILEISTEFLSTPIQSLDSAIGRALERFGRILGADRAWIALPDGAEKGAHVAFSWVVPGLDALPEIESRSCLEALGRVEAGEPLVVESIDRLPEGLDASFVRRSGIRSAVIVPIGSGGSDIGCVVVDNLRASRTWSGGEIDSLMLFAEIIGHTLLRRSAVRELLVSNERFLLVTRATDDVIYDWDIIRSHSWRNDAASMLAGCRPEEVESSVDWWIERIHPEDRQSVQSVVDEALVGGRSHWSVQYRFRRDDGNWIHVLDRADVLRAPDGTPTRVIGAVTDVSALRKAQEHLEQSEARFRAVLDNVSDVISIVDSTGTWLYNSPSYERVVGVRPAEEIGQSAFARVHPEDVGSVGEQLSRLAAGPSGSTAEIKLRVLNRKLGWRRLHSVGVNLLDYEAVHGIVVISRDVTDLEARERDEERSRRMEALGQLAVRVAHEFNNVLMGIQPSAELLAHRLGNIDGVQSAVHRILESVERGKRISQEILQFTQPSRPDFGTIELHSWLADRLPELRAILPESIRLDLEVSGEVDVRADAGQLREIFERLVRYCRDSISKAGWIAIRAERESANGNVATAPMARITIEDTRLGMDSDEIDTLFEPLFSDRIRGGKGLNLAVVRRFVELQGGTIAVESAPERGMKFHLRIPLAGGLESENEEPPSSAPGIVGRRALVVEDEEAVAWGIGAILESEGAGVAIVSCGADAIPAIERFDPDVVILDVGLPDMDGGELFRQIAARWPRLPVVFSTGHGSERLLDDATGHRVELLLKPYEGGDLIAAVTRLLGSAGGD